MKTSYQVGDDSENAQRAGSVDEEDKWTPLTSFTLWIILC